VFASETVEEEEDESTLQIIPAAETETVAVQQYIVYSPTFGVPAFYFIMQDQSMSRLLLCTYSPF